MTLKLMCICWLHTWHEEKKFVFIKSRTSKFMSFQSFLTVTPQGINSVYSLPSFTIARSEFSTWKQKNSWIASIQPEVPRAEGMLWRHKQGWFSHCWIIQRLFWGLTEIMKPKFVYLSVLSSLPHSELALYSQNLFARGLLPSYRDCYSNGWRIRLYCIPLLKFPSSPVDSALVAFALEKPHYPSN